MGRSPHAILTCLIVLGALAGCAAPGEGRVAEGMDVGSLHLEVAAREPPRGSEPLRFHLRIVAAGLPIYSTWKGEQGALQERPADGTPSDMPLDRFPAVLEPLRRIVDAHPGLTEVRLRNLTLPRIEPDLRTIAMEQTFPRSGAVPDTIAANVTNGLASGNYALAGIPLRIIETDGRETYEINVTAPLTLPVPRTRGLHFIVEPVDAERVSIRLHAPSGAFTSEGCEPVPGTLIPPGHYVLASEARSRSVFRVYDHYEDHALQEKVVDVDLSILGKSTEN